MDSQRLKPEQRTSSKTASLKTTSRHRRRRGRLIHGVRVAMVVGLLIALPSPHQAGSIEPKAASDMDGTLHVPIATDQVTSVEPPDPGVKDTGSDSNENAVLRTLPMAADIVGYRGPTEAILTLDDDDRVASVSIGRSFDTPEHVARVVEDTEFVSQFIGLTWGAVYEDGSRPELDGVSGATLTSFAMAEGILKRLGGRPPSLQFPDPLLLAEAKAIFSTADQIEGDPVARVTDRRGQLLGVLLRTGPIVDDVAGYQGPTELLVGLDTDESIVSLSVRGSYDNTPYVDYVRQDDYFWRAFIGTSWSELAELDPFDAGIEGVSGATMTSMAVADSLPLVAQRVREEGGLNAWLPTPTSWWSSFVDGFKSIRWSTADLATLLILVSLPVALRSGVMRHRTGRRIWLVVVIVGIGLWSGNLVSLALITGWASSGVTWQLAIGLFVMVGVALLSPPVTKGNPYCNHLCPHGAVQQLVRPTAKSWRLVRVPRRLQTPFLRVPPLTLAATYLVLLVRPQTDVSVVEPFHAYLWRVAAISSVIFAIATVLASCFVPMAYCRLACPTGRLIDHLRLSSVADRWTRTDWGCLSLLLLAWSAAGIRSLTSNLN
ncbi:MAG: FMN-binding protein [Planctomycetota bacterium]